MFIKSFTIATLIGLSGIVLSGCVADDGGGYYGGSSGGYSSVYVDSGYYNRDRYDRYHRRDRDWRESRRDRDWKDRPRRDREDRGERRDWADRGENRPRPPVVAQPERPVRNEQPDLQENQNQIGNKRYLRRMPGFSDRN